jgi:hypothetical protein
VLETLQGLKKQIGPKLTLFKKVNFTIAMVKNNQEISQFGEKISRLNKGYEVISKD